MANAAGGAHDGTSEAMGGQVVCWDDQGVGHWLMLVAGWGPGWDGEWLGLATFEVADPVTETDGDGLPAWGSSRIPVGKEEGGAPLSGSGPRLTLSDSEPAHPACFCRVRVTR